MKLKNNDITINGIRPELLFALIVCEKVYSEHNQELVITSLNDSRHSIASLHYSGCAADLRTNYFKKETIPIVVNEIKNKLNIDYDVIRESNHIHIEYQPKRRD